MIRIASAGNTEAPCHSALLELGFAVTVERVDDDELWTAEKEDVRITAQEGPCMLLGLVKLIEMRGEQWRTTDGEIANFLKELYTAYGSHNERNTSQS